MRNAKALNEYCAKQDKEIYDALVNADNVWVETSWWTTHGDRGYPDVDNLNGTRLELSDSDVYKLVYEDANVADFIIDFAEIAAGSIDSFEEYYENLSAKTGYAREEYPAIEHVQFAVIADGEPPVMWNLYYFD